MTNSNGLRSMFMVSMIAFLAAACDGAPKSDGDRPVMEFVRIPAGSFQMGSPDSEADRHDNEGPVHEVRITKPFYMGKYEVTQAQWKAVMGTTVNQQRQKAESPWHLKGNDPECPIYYVSWEEAVEFCKRLGNNFRLPTEAEWEYACRAGSQTRFHYGDDPNYSELDQYAWYYGNSNNKTHPVGQKKPNAWGLYDIYGNVREWCSDRYVILGNYEGAGSVDPTGLAFAKNSLRVCRGGSWLEKPNIYRSASRGAFTQAVGYDLIGFRVVYTGRTGGDEEIVQIALPEKAASNTAISDNQSEKVPQAIVGLVRDEMGLSIDDFEMRILPIQSWSLRQYAKGSFEIYKYSRSSESEERYLLVRHVGRNLAALENINEDANMLDVKLKPGVILTGKVVNDDGKAIENAIVGIALQDSGWRAIIPPVGMKTDMKGKFSFRALPMGCKYSFYARLLHYRPSKFEFNTNDARDNRVDLGPIVLSRGQFSVSGIVVDANGKPVPDVWVYCTGRDQVGINSHTEADGRFKADGIFEGQVDIMASIKGDDGGWLGGSASVKAGATNVRIVLSGNAVPPPKGRACFPGETRVSVDGVLVRISEVVKGQSVGMSHRVEPTALFGQIERIEEHIGVFECRDILLDTGNQISVVDSHCFMLDSGRWLAAQDLKPGLRLKTLNGSVGIQSVTVRQTPIVGKVYNLKVTNSDCYVVGDDGVIVRDY